MADQEQNVPLTQVARIQDKYIESFNFLQARKRRQVRQLGLLNNLQRGDQNIASTLLLTLFNRVLSSLYDDKPQVKFLPSQGIEQEQLDSYNILFQSDYLEMNKAKLDYDWDWDTIAFGRGYCETYKFNIKRKIMEPCVINPLVFGYDPYFEEVQDWRYYWKWITKSEWELKRLIKNGTINGIKKPTDIQSGVDEYLWNYKSIRDLAKKAIEPPPQTMGEDIYQILEFYGYDDHGDKTCFWVDKGFTTILYQEKLEFDDLDYGDGDVGSKWPIVVKECFREPHSSVSFGVFDLLEDKHRAKSVLLNLAYIAAKDKANPLYLYNPDFVNDVTQFMSRQVSQHIPVSDLEKAVAPMNTQEPMSPELLQFISLLTTEANEPVGTGSTAQPQQKRGSDTATESAIDQQLSDMAQSLQSKVMQFGEQEFASHWFHRYAKYADELKEKMANIVGINGIESTLVDFKDFNTDYPPGVYIYSAKEAEYKNTVKRRDWMQMYPNLQQSIDPDGLRNFNKHIFFPLMIEDPSTINLIFPKTLDEIKAEDENKQLVDDKFVEAQPQDNHTTHIYTHNMIPPGKRTWAMWFHIAQHEQMLAESKQMGGGQQQGGQQQQQKVAESISFKDLPPDGQVQMAAQAGIKLDPQAVQQQAQQQTKPQGSAPTKSTAPPKINVGKEARSPVAAASPLKSAINPNNSIK